MQINVNIRHDIKFRNGRINAKGEKKELDKNWNWKPSGVVEIWLDMEHVKNWTVIRWHCQLVIWRYANSSSDGIVAHLMHETFVNWLPQCMYAEFKCTHTQTSTLWIFKCGNCSNDEGDGNDSKKQSEGRAKTRANMDICHLQVVNKNGFSFYWKLFVSSVCC